ncbi:MULTISPECIES: hypothetical protein [unclassified Acinetobacter]|uniref:hypothetical protein n=1 Tax=unclassified Acinetobacter TaxID=196816 RepID=UPI0035B8C271
MKKLAIIKETFVTIFVLSLFGFGIFLTYSHGDYLAENPYLYDKQYYHRPNKEQLKQLLDELTSSDKSYYDESYTVKSYAGLISVERRFRENKADMILKNLKSKKFMTLKENKSYCYGEIEIRWWNFENSKKNEVNFSIDVIWDPDNECRQYLWGGLHPRALQEKVELNPFTPLQP